jgi:hypothetical protein
LEKAAILNETVWKKVVEHRNFQRKMERRQTNRESISFSGRAVLKGTSLLPSPEIRFFAGNPIKEGVAALDKEAEK